MARHRIYTPRRVSHGYRHKRKGDNAVERIYRDDDGQLPNFSRLDRHPSKWRRWVIGGGLVALAILAVAAWASFLIFKPYSASSGGNINVTIDTPATATIGEEIAYRLTVANGDRVPLATAALEVRFPDDFTATAAEPAPDDARGFRWTLGTIPPNERKTIDIRGRIYGAPGSSARVEATAVYRPANFNADFQSIADATTVLAASPIALMLKGPDRVVPGAAVTYVVTYDHGGALTTPPTIVTLEVPRNFIFVSAEPKRSRGDALLWNIGPLEPNAKGKVTVNGSFNAGDKEPAVIRATVAIEPIPDRRITLQTQERATAVLGGDVVLIATANDQTGGFAAVSGDALRLRIAIRNDGDEELRELTAYAIFEATSIAERSILNFSGITDPANGTAFGEQLAPGLRRGAITWTTKELPGLASLAPGEQRRIDFTLPIHTAASLPGFPDQGRVTFSAAVDIEKTGSMDAPRRVTTTPIEIKITAF